MSKINEKIALALDKIKNSKFNKAIIVVLLIAMGVVAVAITFTGNVKTESVTNESSYVEILEKKLEKSLSLVKGVGKASVAITVESGMKTVLAMKTTTKTINENTAGGDISVKR